MLLRELVQSAVLQDPNCFLKYLQRPGWLLVHVGDADTCRSYSPLDHPPTSTHIRQGLAAPRFVSFVGAVGLDRLGKTAKRIQAVRCHL